MRFFILMCLIVSFSLAKPLYVDETTNFYDILPHAQIYIDKTKSLSLDDIKTKKFTLNKENLLSYGYSPDFSVWVKITLENDTDNEISKILENEDSHVTYISLYDDKIIQKLGVIYRGKGDDKLTPYFKIKLEPHQEKTIYVSYNCPLGPLHVKPILWSPEKFTNHMNNKYLLIGLFFGVLCALFIYNIFILIFTKDIAYLWYCLYLFSITTHQLYYTGILELSILKEPIETRFIINLLIALSLLFIPFFTRAFLQTKQNWPFVDRILAYIPLYIIVIVIFVQNPQIMIKFFVPTSFIYIYICFGALIKNIKQAKYYAFGWSSIAIGLLWMGLYNLGIITHMTSLPFLIQSSIVFEALIFSVGLASRINNLKQEKLESDKILFEQQRTEKKRLERVVTERTKELVDALDERELLMKELNHRVKNNMQLIVSLLRLQVNSADDEKLIDSLKVAEYRIQAMSHLHELLYSQETVTHINMTEYIKNMVTELSSNFNPNKSIDISLHIEGKLPLKQAVYIGLILNEMLTNAFKYAFKDKGKIKIEFTCKEDKTLLYVKDNGVGFDVQDISPESLGCMVIRTLIEKQLKGKYTLNTQHGTSWKVEFKI